ncbi:MAG: SDR family oxidoreductase [Proteobacteria bacterium]|nr:SDR family oxidoreductase [Pseudomonadota bacterium]
MAVAVPELHQEGVDRAVLNHRAVFVEAHQRHVGAAVARLLIALEQLELSDLSAVERFGRSRGDAPADALVLCAASYTRTPFGEISAAAAESEMRVNAVAPLLLVQALAPALARSALTGGGSVVAFGDIHAMGRPRRAFAPYLMSKAAVHCMVESLALELGPAVRVNAVAPGVVAWPDDAPEEERAAYEARIPLARPGTPEDAARMVRSITEDMPYVTGSVFRLDGGRWLR